MIAIGRTSVRVGVVGLHTGHVGTGVVLVGDTVVVAIRGAAVGPWVVGADAGHIGASVVRVDDAVKIAVRGRSGRRRLSRRRRRQRLRRLRDARRVLERCEHAKRGGAGGMREARTRAEPEAKIAGRIVPAPEQCEGRRSLAEERIRMGDAGAPEELRTDQELLVERAGADRESEVGLGPGGVPREPLTVRAVHDPQRSRVGERANVTCEGHVRPDADRVVAEKLLGVAGREPDATSHGERDLVPVIANQPKVGAGAQIPYSSSAVADDALATDDAAGRRAVLGERDGKADAQSQALEEDDRTAEVQEQLVSDDAGVLRSVGIEEDVRLVAVVRDEAERGSKVAADVERVVGEPLAPALRRLEAIERESGRALRQRRACPRGDGCAGQRATEQDLMSAFARSATFHGFS